MCIPSSSGLGIILKICALLAGLKKEIILGRYVFQFSLYNRNMPQTLGCYLGEKQTAFSDHCHPYLHPVKASYLVLGQFPEALAQCSESLPSRERMSLCVAPWFEQCTSSFLCACALSAGHTQTDRQSCYGSRHLNHLSPLPKISVCYCFH